MQNKNIKIAIVAYSLETGGLSKVIINLFQMLDAVEEIEVQLLLINNTVDINFTTKYINFDNPSNNGSFFLNKVGLYNKFKKHLKKSKFDYIIDQRYRINPISEFVFVKLLYSRTKVIYNVHSAKIENYFLKNKWLSKYLFGNTYKIVCCSKGLSELVKKERKLNNVSTIYNGIELNNIKNNLQAPFNFKYILAVGRIEPIKQFNKLIEAYSKSNLPQKNVKLVLVGDGSDLLFCKNLAKDLNLLDKVVFTGLVNTPYVYMQNALFLILCSENEGFPMVLLESLACETPVISFDLFTGPNEIIIPDVNGILVENQNFDALTNAINMLENDRNLYKKYKTEAKKSILKFSNTKIKEDWLKLLK